MDYKEIVKILSEAKEPKKCCDKKGASLAKCGNCNKKVDTSESVTFGKGDDLKHFCDTKCKAEFKTKGKK